jgi:hypothetical protein
MERIKNLEKGDIEKWWREYFFSKNAKMIERIKNRE